MKITIEHKGEISEVEFDERAEVTALRSLDDIKKSITVHFQTALYHLFKEAD